MQTNTNEITPEGAAGGNVAQIAEIGVEKAGWTFYPFSRIRYVNRLKVVTATLWDEKHERDFPGILEGMLDMLYDDEEEVRDAVKQILSDSNVDYSVVQVDIHYIN